MTKPRWFKKGEVDQVIGLYRRLRRNLKLRPLTKKPRETIEHYIGRQNKQDEEITKWAKEHGYARLLRANCCRGLLEILVGEKWLKWESFTEDAIWIGVNLVPKKVRSIEP